MRELLSAQRTTGEEGSFCSTPEALLPRIFLPDRVYNRFLLTQPFLFSTPLRIASEYEGPKSQTDLSRISDDIYHAIRPTNRKISSAA